MPSPAESSPANPAGGAPLLPFNWHLMQAMLIVCGIVGVGAGLWQSTWWNHRGEDRLPYTGPKEVGDWLQAKSSLQNQSNDFLKWTNLAQLTLSAALVIGGPLMGARFAGLRTSMLAVGWIGILYAVLGSSVYVWYLSSWASWAGSMPAGAEAAGVVPLSATSGWALAVAFGLLGLGKLLFFVIVIGYFGRFDVRAYLEDPPAWFATSSVRPSVAP